MNARDFKEKIETDIQHFLAEKFEELHKETGLLIKDIELIPVMRFNPDGQKGPVVKLTLI